MIVKICNRENKKVEKKLHARGLWRAWALRFQSPPQCAQ
jgi:hypothetical protein